MKKTKNPEVAEVTEENKMAISVGKVAGALGKGLFAGLIGTAAITVSQSIEMILTDREPSTIPADAAAKVLGIQPIDDEKKPALANEVHWLYGTSWGIFRGLLGAMGVKGISATLLHFAAIYGGALTIQPSLDLAPPVKEWNMQTIITEGIHHFFYSLVAGSVYDAIDKNPAESEGAASTMS